MRRAGGLGERVRALAAAGAAGAEEVGGAVHGEPEHHRAGDRSQVIWIARVAGDRRAVEHGAAALGWRKKRIA